MKNFAKIPGFQNFRKTEFFGTQSQQTLHKVFGKIFQTSNFQLSQSLKLYFCNVI